ncbi:MAG: LSU ribosomal protein L32p @ LSU ribosomal protein L32p, zinc-dependent, partial [uncultured Nocardioidaceae bacterium]
GCSQAEDVAQQHASPPFAVEGRCALAGDLCQPRLRREAPAAPRVPRVRPVRRPRSASPGPL